MRTILTMLFALLAIVVRAQDAHVMGHVADEKGEHLHYVTVMLKGTTIGGMSDETGHYFLKDLPVVSRHWCSPAWAISPRSGR